MIVEFGEPRLVNGKWKQEVTRRERIDEDKPMSEFFHLLREIVKEENKMDVEQRAIEMDNVVVGDFG